MKANVMRYILMLMLCLCGLGTAYGQDVSNVDAEDADGKEPSSPTFVPMVKVSKALVGGDSICGA